MPEIQPLRVPFHRSLRAKLMLGLLVVLAAMLAAVLLVLYARGYELLLARERAVAKINAEQLASEMNRELAVAEGLAAAMGKLGEALPKDDVVLWKSLLPAVINLDGQSNLIAGGGVWPEPYAFDPKLERRSFFWGRAADGSLNYFDDYNAPDGPGYHHEEWYVPARFQKTGECYWSRSYRDPYSAEAMVTCSMPMHSEGRFSGVSTVDVKLSGLQTFLAAQSKVFQGYAFALDRNGLLITTPSAPDGSAPVLLPKPVDALTSFAGSHAEFQPMSDWLAEPLKIAPDTATRELAALIDEATTNIEAEEATRIAMQLRAPDGHPAYLRQITVARDPLLGEEALLTHLIQPTSNWQLVVVQPERLVRESVFTIMRRVGTALVLAIVAVMGLAAWMLRAMLVEPIQKLADQLNTASAPERGQHVSVESTDEIGLLACQINEYADRIVASGEAAEAAAEQFRAVTELAHDALIQVDDAGLVVGANRSSDQIFGYAESDWAQLPFERLMAWDPRTEFQPDHAPDVGSRAASQVRQLSAIRNDGSAFPAEVSVSYWRGPKFGRYNVQVRDVTERLRNEEQVRMLATHDVLTGLPNRALFRDRLTRAVERCQMDGTLMALLFLDLDHFKLANDSLGHEAGDQLLRAVAERLLLCVRRGDTVARLGGDEFALLLPNLDDPTKAAIIAAKAIEDLARPFELSGQKVQIGGSIGIALCPIDDDSADELLRKVDLAMYHAKAEGRNTYRFFTKALHAALIERKTLLDELTTAVREGSFELHYQPVVSAEHGTLYGFEALLRWSHPEHGLVMPDKFIPLAEQSGLIVPIGDWVISRACAELAEWQRQHGLEVKLSINLSLAQFRDQELVGRLERGLSRHGLKAEQLILELTETVLMHDHEDAIEIMQRLRALGLSLAVDDFGTGYSSLAYLKRFPVQKLKIDKSFVSGLSDNEESAAICRSVIALGHNLGLAIVAEGVENKLDLAFLRAFRCEYAQGFLFSEPKPLRDLDPARWQG
ncbi:MAG: EAL domain-containing protein [Ahniella sp.]|nr:EAL domain-containing protein [Ahniella sp.]